MPRKHNTKISLRKIDEIADSFEVNPDLYTHLTIIEALKAPGKGLEAGDANNGLLALIIAVDQLEQICLARGIIKADDDEYKAKLAEKEKTLKITSETNTTQSLIKQARLANYRLGILMEHIFGSSARAAELVL